MADRSLVAVKPQPIWMKQAEAAKIKSDAESDAAAKAAFDATFKSIASAPPAADSDSDTEAPLPAPAGAVDPSRTSAAGLGLAGGTAGAPSTFVVTTKDSDARRIPSGGAAVKVTVCPGVGVGGADQDGAVKDLCDGTYAVTYVVPKRGNYMVHIDCNGKPIMGSPFPVFFSQGTVTVPGVSLYSPAVNQTMPNMPNYTGSTTGLMGMIPGATMGNGGGIVLQGIGATLGEICPEYLHGRCAKTDCKLNHPPQNLLMSVLAATTTRNLSQAPMGPSAAAMAAAQAIIAARALEAHAAQMQTQQPKADGIHPSAMKSSLNGCQQNNPWTCPPGSAEPFISLPECPTSVRISNLSPLLAAEQLKELFSFFGTVVDCTITDTKQFAYVEFSKPEEADVALALNNMDVGGRLLNVEMAKSLPAKSTVASTSLLMQQAVAVHQKQFQQALIMQQAITTQQAATRAATMKSANEMASARAAEISKMLKVDGLPVGDNEVQRKSRSPSVSRRRSKSRSRSPIKYRRSRRSRSFSPQERYLRDRRLPVRDHYSNRGTERSYRGACDISGRNGRRERERSHDRYSSVSRRQRSRSPSPRWRKSSHATHGSPKQRRESRSPKIKRSSGGRSRSPMNNRGNRSSRHSRSISAEKRHHSNDKDAKSSHKPRHRHSRSRSAEGRHK